MTKNNLSLKKIQLELSKSNDLWEAGSTSLSSFSLEEQKLHLGFTPGPNQLSMNAIIQQTDKEKEALKIQALKAVGVPKSYDLRNVDGKNFVTPIKDQLSCGSCVAFGVAATIESTLRKQNNDPNLAIDLSEAHLFFCHARDSGRTCDNGWWSDAALEDIKNKGIVDETCYPYDDNKTDCSGLCSDSGNRLMKITGYTDLTSKPADIKTWISTKGPVVASYIVYEDFYSYKSGTYKHVTGENVGGHCVTIVGYNDTGGYWICKNSWGTNWGEKGFFKIAYGECGIDSWSNQGVKGIEKKPNSGWQKNSRVIGLWAINEDRNAQVYFDNNVGLKKISHTNDNVFFDMLSQLIAAKASGRRVDFYEENNIIKQIYVI